MSCLLFLKRVDAGDRLIHICDKAQLNNRLRCLMESCVNTQGAEQINGSTCVACKISIRIGQFN
jgi:hypothetical protein